MKQNELFEQCKRLIAKIAKRYSNDNMEYMDLFQAATANFLRYAGNFDPEKGKLSTYAGYVTSMYLARYTGKEYEKMNANVDISEIENKAINEDYDTYVFLQEVYETLTDKQREVWDACCEQYWTDEDFARNTRFKTNKAFRNGRDHLRMCLRRDYGDID